MKFLILKELLEYKGDLKKMKEYDLAPINCQNCKYCKYKDKGNAICSKKNFPIPEEKLTAVHVRECIDYRFWISGKEKVKK
jgi:hypothetical protein